MAKPLKIANAQAFWGDRNDAARELVAQVPDLDYLTLDYLAEVSLSILAQQRTKNPDAGFPRDFLEVFQSLIPYWHAGGQCRLITNAGGLNPAACARACAKLLADAHGPSLQIAFVDHDDVLSQLQDPRHPHAESLFHHLESGQSVTDVRDRLVTANAYLGAAPIVEALTRGADIVITGRVADPSLTLAACIHHFGWKPHDWDRWAQGTVAGHLIECGVQVTGGISTDWLSIPSPESLGFPVIEMDADGSFVVTKPAGTGGAVTRSTVTEQLVYEIGDPGKYLSPDLTVSFLNLSLEEVARNRIRVTGAKGSPPTATYKVSATYRDGYRAAGLLTLFGRDAERKAKRCGDVVLQRMRAAGWTWRDAVVECIGTGACAPGLFPESRFDELLEVALRISIEADDERAVEYFSRQMIPLVTSGPQGMTGYAEGRPRVHPIVRYWPCLIDRRHVTPRVELLPLAISSITRHSTAKVDHQSSGLPDTPFTPEPTEQSSDALEINNRRPTRLGDLAYARSGDKGTSSNIGVICRNAQDYAQLAVWLTADRVHTFLQPIGEIRVERFELPNLAAFNFVIHGALRRSLRVDAQGKALGQVLLEMPLDAEWST